MNVVWLLVDSIRNYPTDLDLRGKLPVMQRFGRDAVEFTSCVTTAPSTVMSITAMMTGLPAYFLARNYEDFRFDDRVYDSLASVLKAHGYESYAFLRGPQTREKFRNLLDPVPRDYWLPHLRHRFKWTNEDLIGVLDRVLAAGVRQPAFFFFHFNPQTRSVEGETLADPAISDRVQQAWDRLESAGFGAGNTIYIMCSDHGFPDPSTGMTSEWEARHRLSHDLVLTDDNILIPLYIRYPGCEPSRITVPVSSLDLFPTILDLLAIPERDEIKAKIDGLSLLSLMQGADPDDYPRRYFRSDSRLMLQTGRSTAIRSRDYKYIRYHDHYRLGPSGEPSPTSEVLIDLRSDRMEEDNLLLADELPPELSAELGAFRAELERTETRALDYHIRYLLTRQGGKLDTERRIQRALLIFEPDTAGYDEIGFRALSSAYPSAQIDVLTSDRYPSYELSHHTNRVYTYAHTPDGRATVPDTVANGARSGYDLVVLFVQDPSARGASNLLQIARSIDSDEQIVLDCNFNASRQRRYWYYRFRAFVQSIPDMLEEPALLLSKLRLAGRLVGRRILNKLGMHERWQDAARVGPENE